MGQMDDNALIKQILASEDKVLFGQLVSKYKAEIKRFLLYYLRGENIFIDDLVQNTFVNAYKFLDQYDEHLPFSTWLYTIAKNQFCDHYRHRKRLHEVELIESEIDDLPIAEFADDYDIDFFDTVISVVENLNKREQMLVNCFYFKDMSIEQISAQTDIPPGTITVILRRARQKIAKIIK
ncbi:MAG: sigma-70 family RNA polymerase sigma factor [Bacteroidales bacterium]|jgi:RNA polymerase sigma-70 factor (ECF subfamily)|nr:sigma-70 family RNA polymerase sigma factor [Bacteroidales bacterium]